MGSLDGPNTWRMGNERQRRGWKRTFASSSGFDRIIEGACTLIRSTAFDMLWKTDIQVWLWRHLDHNDIMDDQLIDPFVR